MYIDIFGKKRQKIGLHMHTNLSDGSKTPFECAQIYRSAGYDAIALTDHWHWHDEGEIAGVRIISGVEYDFGGRHTELGVYHILGLFAKRDPDVSRDDSPQVAIDKIHATGGLAVLAHPAWSLNTPEMIMALEGVDATEIYNTVSAVGQSFRADSSLIVDMIASRGRDYPLLAADDSHYYNGEDNCVSYVMAECDSVDSEKIKNAILERRFYASQGPELHLSKEGDIFRVHSSPVEHIYFASNTAWCVRTAHGEGICSAEYKPVPSDLYVRAFAVDKEGRSAWSNIVML